MAISVLDVRDTFAPQHVRVPAAVAPSTAVAPRRIPVTVAAAGLIGVVEAVGLLAVALTEAVMELEPISLRLREGASGEIRSMLLDGGVDFGLLYDAEPLDQFEIKRLAREDLYLIGPPGKFAGIGGEPVITLSAHVRRDLPRGNRRSRGRDSRRSPRAGFDARLCGRTSPQSHRP